MRKRPASRSVLSILVPRLTTHVCKLVLAIDHASIAVLNLGQDTGRRLKRLDASMKMTLFSGKREAPTLSD